MTATERQFTMTQERIDAWAQLSGDFNPLHVSPEYARTTPFGGTIAHGHISLGVLEGLMLEIVGEEWLRGGKLEGARFRAPIRPGRTYRAIADMDPNDAVRWYLKVVDEDETICVEATAVQVPSTSS
jgi:acyl dehydratase